MGTSSPMNRRITDQQGPSSLDVRDLRDVPDGCILSSSSQQSEPTDNRKLLVIFNFESFRGGKYSWREGTDIDIARIKKLFRSRGYDVLKTFRNLYSNKVFKKIDDLVEKDLSRYDTFVCIFLSHGEEGQLVCSDATPIAIEDLLFRFREKECKSLRGKPKIFIFQTCQGSFYDYGQSTDQIDAPLCEDLHRAQQIQAEKMCKPSAIIPTSEPTNLGLRFCNIRPFKNFIVALSTFPGYVSWRNSERGTYFVQHLCDVIEGHAHEDVESQLTLTANRIAYEFRSASQGFECLQMPCTISTLKAKAYF